MPVKLWCPDMGRKAGVILARGPNRDGSKGFQNRQGRGNVATFTATHKQWHGQVELFPDGTFTRVGKDGGTWKTVWDEQRDTDDGGQSGDLILTWEKWGDEKLRSSDGGHVFKHQEYTFELELMSAQVPMWITTEMDSPPSSPDDDPRAPTSRSDDPRAQRNAAPIVVGGKARNTESWDPESTFVRPEMRSRARRAWACVCAGARARAWGGAGVRAWLKLCPPTG